MFAAAEFVLFVLRRSRSGCSLQIKMLECKTTLMLCVCIPREGLNHDVPLGLQKNKTHSCSETAIYLYLDEDWQPVTDPMDGVR